MATILIIEDDAAILAGVKEVLGFEGYDTLSAIDGIDGINMASEHVPDLILCDIRMPRADGFEVHAALQNNPDTAAIPFVFVTAKINEFTLQADQDAIEYLTKPFNIDELLAVIKRHLAD